MAVSQGVFYYAYEVIREMLTGPPGSPKRTFTNLENLVIGAVAGRPVDHNRSERLGLAPV